MTAKLLAAIEAVQRELAKGTPGPWYQNYEQDGETDGNGTVYLDDTVSPTGELYHVNEYIGHIAHTTDANNIAAMMNAAPGMLEAAREQINASIACDDLRMDYSYGRNGYPRNPNIARDYAMRGSALEDAVRAMLSPLFEQYSHLPEVQALEVER